MIDYRNEIAVAYWHFFRLASSKLMASYLFKTCFKPCASTHLKDLFSENQLAHL